MASVLRHEERDTILTMLTIPNARRILWCLRSLSVEIRKTQLHLSTAEIHLFASMAETQLSASMVLSQLSTDSFSKSSNSQDHLFRLWCHPHSSPISCLVFIMTMVIVISFACERKTAPNDNAPELLTRIVQSPTKLNKI